MVRRGQGDSREESTLLRIHPLVTRYSFPVEYSSVQAPPTRESSQVRRRQPWFWPGTARGVISGGGGVMWRADSRIHGLANSGRSALVLRLASGSTKGAKARSEGDEDQRAGWWIAGGWRIRRAHCRFVLVVIIRFLRIAVFSLPLDSVFSRYSDRVLCINALNGRGRTLYCDQNRDPPIQMCVGPRECQPQDREEPDRESDRAREKEKEREK